MYMFMPYNQFHFQQKILPSISIIYCGIFTSYLQIRSLLGILIQWPSLWRDLGGFGAVCQRMSHYHHPSSPRKTCQHPHPPHHCQHHHPPPPSQHHGYKFNITFSKVAE